MALVRIEKRLDLAKINLGDTVLAKDLEDKVTSLDDMIINLSNFLKIDDFTFMFVGSIISNPTTKLLDKAGLVTHYISDLLTIDTTTIDKQTFKLENNVGAPDEVTLTIDLAMGLLATSARPALVTISFFKDATGGTLLSPLTATNIRQKRAINDFLTVTQFDETDQPVLSNFIGSEEITITEESPANIFEVLQTIDNSEDSVVFLQFVVSTIGGGGNTGAEFKMDLQANDFNFAVVVTEKDLKQT